MARSKSDKLTPLRGKSKAKQKSPKQTVEAKARRKAVMEANRLVAVYLRMEHTIKGVVYGPGDTKLPNALAQSLLHQESHTLKIDSDFRHGRRGVLIGKRGRGGSIKTTDVPYDSFNDSLTASEPVNLNDIQPK